MIRPSSNRASRPTVVLSAPGRSSVPRRHAVRLAVAFSLAGALLAGPAVMSAEALVSRTGTPTAELATLALSSLRGREAPVQPLNVVTNSAPIVNLLNTQLSPAPLPVSQSAPGLNQGTVATPEGWSSTVVDSGNVPPPGAASPAPAQFSSPQFVPQAQVISDGSDPRSRYPLYRAQLAQEVAAKSGLNAAALDALWARTDERRLTALFTGLAQVGTYYRSGGTDPNGFDCSGFTGYSWSAAGVKLPRTSGDQINGVAPRSQDQLQPGDLVWRSGHIAMYVGMADIVIDSPQTGKAVGVKQWGRVSRFGSPV